MVEVGLPEFEVVDHPDARFKGFSLIRPKVSVCDSDQQQFAEAIREEVCEVCNASNHVRSCMGVLYSDSEGISARISKTRGQSKRCLLLIPNLDYL